MTQQQAHGAGSERTRQLILESAEDFLWENPFRDLTIATLMDATGVTRPAFYHYFHDRHDLMESLLRDFQEELQARVTTWFTQGGVPELAEALSAVVEVCYERGPILRAMVESAPMDPRLEAAWQSFMKGWDDQTISRIRQDKAAGLSQIVDAEVTGIALARMNVGTLVHYFGRKPRQKKALVAANLSQVWISAIYGSKAWSDYEKKHLPLTP